MYVVTGATGQLGRLVIQGLIEAVGPSSIIAAVRDPARAQDLAALGVTVRAADYDRPETLAAAFAGADKLLLISSNDLGGRRPQHRAVIDAAKAAGVSLIAYTSVLRADVSPLGLAADHRDTEAALAASGVPHVLLRNGWYSENHLAGLAPALQYGVLMGAAQDGRVSSAARADYAAAAVAALTTEGQAGEIHELAGDAGWTLSELAAEISRQSGKAIAYQDMPPAAFADVLKQSGLPAPLAELLADSDAAAAKGALFDDSGALARVIGRPTTPLAVSLTAALEALAVSA